MSFRQTKSSTTTVHTHKQRCKQALRGGSRMSQRGGSSSTLVNHALPLIPNSLHVTMAASPVQPRNTLSMAMHHWTFHDLSYGNAGGCACAWQQVVATDVLHSANRAAQQTIAMPVLVKWGEGIKRTSVRALSWADANLAQGHCNGQGLTSRREERN